MSGRLKIVIVGAGGRLGAALLREYRRDFEVIGFNRAQLDLAEPGAMRETLGALEFDLLINAAAQTNVDRCETHPDEAHELNAIAPRVLAEICSARRAKMIHISTDYVFDGEQQAVYREEDAPNPISVYGSSKLEGEKHVLAIDPRNLVARVSWVFGPDRPSFIDWVIGQAREKEQVAAVADKWSTPTYTLDLASMLRALFTEGNAEGLLHLTDEGGCSWREYGQWALDCCRNFGMPLRTQELGVTTLAEMKNFVARRPVHTVLSPAKFQELTGHPVRSWQNAVAEYVRDFVAHPPAKV